METKSIELVWIVVKDLKKAVKFYTETVGLKLDVMSEEFGWAELHGHQGGARLGIAQEKDKPNSLKSGQNACVTLTVENLDKALKHLHTKHAKCIGKIQEIPGHVKMQMVADADGNIFQVVEKLY
jgi:predicted enzyme related to lactoylglutathione lyase